MTETANRRIDAKITLRADGSADVAVFLIGTDGKPIPLRVPPVGHPEAFEGFIYALAVQHGVAADAVAILLDDQRSPFRGHQPPGQVH